MSRLYSGLFEILEKNERAAHTQPHFSAEPCCPLGMQALCAPLHCS